MQPSSGLQPAYLLHRRPYSNTSLLVECFSALQGRLPAIAKGVIGGKGKRAAAGLLQPFVPMLIRCSGRGEVKNLAQYEALSPAITLQGRTLYCGFYVNELLMRLLQRNDPHEALFALYDKTLRELASALKVEQTLRQFEVSLLGELGYGLVLDRDVSSGEPLNPERRYQYLFEQGPVATVGSETSSIKGSTLLALHRNEPLGPQALREARQMMRHILSAYLGEKPLKSRELFRSSIDSAG